MQAALIGPTGQTMLGPAGLTIGRMQSNQYVVYDRRVSARHAVISFLKQGYFTITDIGSTNGTFVNGLQLIRDEPHILRAGDSICIGDTVLTFQISDPHILAHDISPHNENSPKGDSSATDRLTRVRYRPDVQYQPLESQEKQAPLVPNYTQNHTMWQAATVTPSQKVDEIATLQLAHASHQNIVHPPPRSHCKILITLLLVVLLLLGVIAISSFKYLNRSTPDKTLDIFCKALRSKDYQSIYDQLSIKLQGLGSEKLIADNLSNVKECTYRISERSENFVAAKLTFKGLSGQQVSGTMILIKDSNNSWKINDLQNI